MQWQKEPGGPPICLWTTPSRRRPLRSDVPTWQTCQSPASTEETQLANPKRFELVKIEAG
jgi:hypothetical protein